MKTKNYFILGLFLGACNVISFAQCGVRASDDATIVCGEEAQLDGYSTWSKAIDSSSVVLGFRSVFFTDSETGYTVGESGIIHKTTDGGKNWVDQISGTSVQLTSVFFTDANTGFTIGNPYSATPSPILLKTTNGGTDWVPQAFSAGGNMSQVLFTNANTGFIVGEYGTIFKTTDGGINWSKKTANTMAWIHSIYFLDANNGYAGARECLLKTTDGGESWSVLQGIALVSFNSIQFTDINTGFAAGSDGRIYKTTNGGTTWKDIPLVGLELNAVHFTDANTGYVAGAYQIWKTVDAGKTWLSSGDKGGYLFGLSFPTPKIGYTTGQRTFKYIGADTYSWYPATGLNAVNIENPIANPTVTTTYKIIATTGTCAATDSITITVKPFLIDASGDVQLICGGSVPLGVTTNYTGTKTLNYAWFPASGLDATNISNPVASPTHTTRYYVTVTSPNGCTATDSVTVIVEPFTTDIFENSKNINCGATFQLYTYTNYTGTGILSYAWSPATGLSATNIVDPVVSITKTTKYYVTVTTPNGCTATDSITIVVNPLTAVAVSDPTIICGGAAQLDVLYTNYYLGVGALTYSWSPTTGLSSAGSINPSAISTETTTYYVTATTPNGCTAIDSVTVIVAPLTANAGSDKPLICKSTVQLDAVTTNYTGTAPLVYSWGPATGLNNTNVINPLAIAPGTYTVTVTTSNGCTTHDEVVVNYREMDAIDICMVGVDTAKNLVIWNKPVSNAIDSFYVYRETNIAGTYAKIGSVAYTAKSVFKDLTSQPEVKSNKYKISVWDACGLESSKSAAHKTMHLSINKGSGITWNLIWESYEGFPVATYKIYRGTSPTNLVYFDATSGSNNQYTDNNPPLGDVYYQLEIINPNPCDNLTNSVHSNVARNNQVGINEIINNKLTFSIYPNPTTEMLTVNLERKSNTAARLTIYNTLGAVVKMVTLEQNRQQLNVSDLDNGFYTIEVKSANDSGQQKLIIQK